MDSNENVVKPLKPGPVQRVRVLDQHEAEMVFVECEMGMRTDFDRHTRENMEVDGEVH